MKKVISFPIMILIVVATVFLTIQFSARIIDDRYKEYYREYVMSEFSGENHETGFDDVRKTLTDIDRIVRKTYVGEIDEESVKNYTIYGYLAGIGDKYALYMNPEEYESAMKTTGGQMVGIGVNVIYDNTMGGIYIINVTKDSPAKQAGLLPGDIITHVDSQNIQELGYYNAVRYIASGKEGESVELTIRRSPDYTEEKSFDIERKVVEIITVQGYLTKDNIGLIKISEFNRHTPEEFIAVIEQLQSNGAQKFIFDVRNNPGGDLQGIHGVLDYLLPEGPIIRISGTDGNEQVLESDKKELKAPMAVLINDNTASAAELFCSALRDYEKATLIGTTTYGKGTMQTVMELPSGGGLSLSTALYCPPFGENYEGTGVVPHIEITMPEELAARFYFLTDEEDPQISKAVSILEKQETEGIFS